MHNIAKKLNPFMGYDSRAGSQEAAILIFAESSKEARKLGWPVMKALHNTLWLDMATRRLRKNLDYLLGDADQEKLAAGVPHVVVEMRVCPSCEMWGEDGGSPDENGECGYCKQLENG